MPGIIRLAAAALAAIVVSISPGFAQSGAGNAATTTGPSGDAAVSPASGNASGGSVAAGQRPSPGAGVASGVLNNGTTGDTIGTGHGTPSAPESSTAVHR